MHDSRTEETPPRTWLAVAAVLLATAAFGVVVVRLAPVGEYTPSKWRNDDSASADDGAGEHDIPLRRIDGPYTVPVEDEPVVFRTRMPLLEGPVVACGYPSRVNLAYETSTGRLAMVWTGGFLVGTDRPRETRRAGDGVWWSPAGRAFAIEQDLDAGVARWEHLRFVGYRLNDARRPTLMYEVPTPDGSVAIEDALISIGSGSLRRRITARGVAATLLFRPGDVDLVTSSTGIVPSRGWWRIPLDADGSTEFDFELSWSDDTAGDSRVASSADEEE